MDHARVPDVRHGRGRGRGAARLLAVLLAVASLTPVVVWGQADTKHTGQGSGGYVRPATPPASGGYVRPAAPAPTSPVAPRPAQAERPSVPQSSGQYVRPGADSSPVQASPSRGGADRAISRQGSGAALDAYERRKEEAARPDPEPFRRRVREQARPGEDDSPSPWSTPRREATPAPQPVPASPSAPAWVPPAYATPVPSAGGDPYLYWRMLDAMSHRDTDLFREHRDDAGYREWRARAEAQARENGELRSRLDELDRRMATRTRVEPASTNDAPTPAAAAVTPGTDGGHPVLWGTAMVVLLGGAVVLYLLSRRRGRPAARKDEVMFETAKAVIRAKSGDAPPPAPKGPRFRVGQVLTVDPTPFVLAPGTKATAPENGQASVVALGRVDGPVPLVRLHVSDDAFFQIHLDGSGAVDECRFFSRLDTVEPATEDDWAFWLDDAQGMVGYPVFETKDGIRYARVWSPGETRVPPRRLVEEVETVDGRSAVRHDAMLYSTLLPGSKDVHEYLLVSVDKDDGGAGVSIHVGLDVNFASLGV